MQQVTWLLEQVHRAVQGVQGANPSQAAWDALQQAARELDDFLGSFDRVRG